MELNLIAVALAAFDFLRLHPAVHEGCLLLLRGPIPAAFKHPEAKTNLRVG